MPEFPLPQLSEDEFAALQQVLADAAQVLEVRRADFGLPDIEFAPADGDVILFRLPAVERTTEGGLYLPSHQMTNVAFEGEAERIQALDLVVNNGLLLAAGLTAKDWLLAHGIFLGDIVKFGKYAGHEQRGDMYSLRADVTQASMKDVMSTSFRDIRGSFDLHSRLRNQPPLLEEQLVLDRQRQPMHVYKPVVRRSP